ncbi:MlaC/ttg2D family ABC transporter substrate-binding protein [Aliikangiella marina]|nr:ABC transporter substrate-binding protein [Aliikangiella marina]
MRKLLGAMMIILSFSGIAQASDDPSVVLKEIADNMISVLDKNKEALKTDDSLADELVRKHLLPKIDTEYFASRTLGSKIWKTLDDNQKASFTEGYISQVIDKYAKGLALYDGQSFEFEAPEFSKKNPTSARVKSEMKQPGEQPFSINYIMSKKSGSWLITNIIVEGTDMRKSYQQQFRPRINEVGIEQFIAELKTPQLSAN